ncbi:hypothetical protein R4K54_08380 [Brachyspira murdochii]|uniref:hypothetical protein n=1 Tax=Brachyspira murdochii TaxID=84378 RepID=UPI0030074458
MKKIYILLFFIVILAILSCSSPYESDKEKTSPNPDISLKGYWIGSIHGEYLSSIGEFEWFSYYSYKFHDDNLIGYYSSRSKYGIKMNTYSFTYIWKIENGKSYYKLYDNEYDYWREFEIEKIDANTIIIDGVELERQ